ncbi:MAG: TolC family outer membrane protein [Rhizobiaceae bacterium]
MSVLSLLLVSVAPANAMSLKTAVEKAVTENPKIRAAQASRRATDRVLSQAKRRYLPEVSIDGDFGIEKVDKPQAFGVNDNDQWRNRKRIALNIKQTLFDGFERANNVYESQARISAAAHKILARSEVVALNVIEAYIDVRRHDRLIWLAGENVKRHRKLLEVVNTRVEGGKTSDGDLFQTRERLQAAIALRSQIKLVRAAAAAKFKRSVGIGPRRLNSVKMARNPYRSSSEAITAAISKNSRLAALQDEIDSAGFRTDRSRSELFPVVTLEGSASRGEDLDGTNGRADEIKGMVVLRWKLIDGGVRRQRTEELTEREFVKVSEYDAAVRQVGEEIEIAWSKIVEGGRQIAAKRRQLAETGKVVSSYRKEYEANKRSLLDVLDAENSRFAVEFDLSNANSIRLFSGYELLAQTGSLLPYLGIARPKGSEVDESMFRSTKGSSSGSNMFKSFVIPPLR